MQKNSITNKITPCCGLPFSVIYWWVSNLTLNSESDRQYLLTQISQGGILSIDGWKVLINSGTLEADASLTKADFLAWFNCRKQPNCEQLKILIESYKIGNWDAFHQDLNQLNLSFQELSEKTQLKQNDINESNADDSLLRIDDFYGELITYRETAIWADGTLMNDNKIDGKIYLKKGEKYYVDTEFLNNKIVKISRFINDGAKKIHEVFPNVSLAEVQAIEPTANLNNSSAWFLISKLLKWLPKESVIDIDIDIDIDQTIVLKRGFIKLTSSGLKINKIETSSPFLGRRVTIKQTAQNKDIIRVVDGDGTIHINGYIENVVFENLNFIGNFTGDGISFHQTSNLGGTSIHFTFKNVLFGNCKNGFKHYSGHINDFFFEQASFSANYDIGFVLNSDNANQTNYFSFKDCRFDSNGLDTDINGNVIDFVQDLQNPNWNKGGAKINGTAITIIGVSIQANHGFGLWFYGYLYGGFFNGYSEQNVLGDLVADQTKENYKNIVSAIYSSGQNFVYHDDDVKAMFDTFYGYEYDRNLARKEFSQNAILNPHNFELSGGSDVGIVKTINPEGIAEYNHQNGGYLYPKLKTKFEQFKVGEIWSFSFDCFVTDFQGQDFGLHPSLLMSAHIEQLTSVKNSWIRVSFSFKIGNTFPNGGYLMPFIRNQYGTTAGIKIRLPMLQKLETSHEVEFEFDNFKILPKKDDCNATDVAGVVTYLNDLISKLKSSNIMATE